MKKVCFLFLLIFIVFSCKGTPKNKKAADEPGLSQPELTEGKEKVEAAAAELDDEPQPEPDKDMLAQDDITEGSEIAENPEEEGVTNDFQADEQIEEKPLIVEAVDEVKETPEGKNPPVEEKPPTVPEAKSVQPPPAVAKEEPPSVPDASVTEQSNQEKQDDTTQSENTGEQKTVPPRSQPWLSPPPAVSAVKDNAPLPNRQGLVPPKEEEIVFSRIVRATVGQIVEIPFRGTGWVYLGELTLRRGLFYNSRRLDPEGQSFIFTAEEEGTYALKFYRQDFIRDYILNDYVQVIVGESAKGGVGWFNPATDRGRVTAEPRWPSTLDEAALLRGGARPASGAAAQPTPENKNGSSAAPSPALAANTESAQAQGTSALSQTASANRDSVSAQGTTAPSSTVLSNRESTPALTQGADTAPPVMVSPVVTPPSITSPVTAPEKQSTETPKIEKQEKLPPEEILKKAQDTFNEGNTAAAITLLDQYMEYYPNGSDEVYWLYGQLYEANTPSRNILLSLDYYRRLVNEYPQSRRFNDARRRISYLERFYINIQ